MEPFWETEWQGIQFSHIAATSEIELAGADFYNAFYRELFRRYAGYDDLDESWRTRKGELANWILRQLKTPARVLSVGCGLGYIEAILHRMSSEDIELHVSEYATDALRWLRDRLPADRIHGKADSSLVVTGRDFDLIYLSAVDYSMSRAEMIELLHQQRQRLAPSGSCLVISASYIEENPSMSERVLLGSKAVVWRLLGRHSASPGERGQFWGWKRTRTEYRELMRAAGFASFDDGFITTKIQRTYFIRART